MKYFKRKISILTVFVVTTVMFLGIICPMSNGEMFGLNQADCQHGGVTLTSDDHSEMGDCMSGKLGFLASLLVAMPENLLQLILLGFFIFTALQSQIIRELLYKFAHREKIRHLLFEYTSKVKVNLLKLFNYWLSTVERPRSVA